MTDTFEVNPPFDVYTGLDGLPLENGNIYIGEFGLNPETTPITVFWDNELSIPAAQPIRTLAGYPSRDGTPANIFISSSGYSITVRDKNDKLVYSRLSTRNTFQIITYLSVADAVADTALTIGQFITTSAYYASIDGGGADYVVVAGATGTPDGGSYINTDGGLQLQLTVGTDVGALQFGAKVGVIEDSGAAINNCLTAFGRCLLPQGILYRSETISIKAADVLYGYGKGVSTIKTITGANTDTIKTLDFDNLTGTQSLSLAVFPNLPIDFELRDFGIDGNYLDEAWLSPTNTKNNTSGYGVKIYGRRYVIDLKIVNIPDVGFYSECLGAEGDDKIADSKTSTVNLDILVCAQEGLVFRGPSDIRLESVLMGIAGALPLSEQGSVNPVSDLYGGAFYSSYDKIDGCVFDVSPVDGESFNYSGSCEIDFLHSFGCKNGIGIRFLAVNTQGTGNGRIKGQKLISESCLGGYVLEDGIHYQISILDSHNNTGDSQGSSGTPGEIPHIEILTAQQSVISNIEIEKSGFEVGGQTGLFLSGANVSISDMTLNGNGKPGHAIYTDGRNNKLNFHVYGCAGTAADSDPSTGFIREVPFSSAFNNIFTGSIQSCDVGFNSIGESDAEQINLSIQTEAGKTFFTGDKPSPVKAQKWVLTGKDDTTVTANTTRARDDLDGSVTTAQTIVIALSPELAWVPELEDVYLSLADTGTVNNGVLRYAYINGVTTSSITVAYRFDTIITSGEPLRVSVSVVN